MKLIFKKVTMSLFVVLTVLGLSSVASAATVTWPHAKDTAVDKTWTITFSKAVNRATVTSDAVYVTDAAGKKQQTTLTYSKGDTKIHIAAPPNGYIEGAAYTLHIADSIHNLDGTPLKNSITKQFTIQEPVYGVVNVAKDGTQTVQRTYASFAEAASHVGDGQAVVHQGNIVRMPEGLVVTKESPDSGVTILHKDRALKTQMTYVPPNTELKYVSSTETAVEIELAGTTYFIRMENSTLLPEQTITNRSYYYVKNGSLYHNMYSHSTKRYGLYEAGKAPSFMAEGEKYYSTDSVNFTDESGAFVGDAEQYFQYLPLLSQTRYTADELDAYIMKTLLQLERDYPNNPDYTDASKRSKLIGIGKILKQAEAKYHINALHVLALAQHEGKYGMSKHSLENNNLFGLYVTDRNPANKKFDNIESNVDELMTAFLTKNYMPPGAVYANGTNLGNKRVGVNVKYASDPYWGAKVAGHMYRIDRALGGKELANKADIRLTNYKVMNHRKGPSTATESLYSYDKIGMPITVLDDRLPENPWVSVQSDIVPHNPIYIHGDWVDKLNLP